MSIQIDEDKNDTNDEGNNEENPEYESPDGVSGEYNEYEGRFTKEQALSLNFSQINNAYGGIASDEAYFINKFTGYGTMSDDKRNSFFAYKNLEMFVNGIDESSWDSDNVEYCIRLGREDNYYEIRQPFLYTDNSQEWDSVNLNLENFGFAILPANKTLLDFFSLIKLMIFPNLPILIL